MTTNTTISGRPTPLAALAMKELRTQALASRKRPDERSAMTTELARRLGKGGPEAKPAMGVLYELNRVRWLRLIRSCNFHADTGWAEVVLHDAVAKALKRGRQLKDPAKFDGWIHRIITNVAADYWRRASHEFARDDERQPSKTASLGKLNTARLTAKATVPRSLDDEPEVGVLGDGVRYEGVTRETPEDIADLAQTAERIESILTPLERQAYGDAIEGLTAEESAALRGRSAAAIESARGEAKRKVELANADRNQPCDSRPAGARAAANHPADRTSPKLAPLPLRRTGLACSWALFGALRVPTPGWVRAAA